MTPLIFRAPDHVDDEINERREEYTFWRAPQQPRTLRIIHLFDDIALFLRVSVNGHCSQELGPMDDIIPIIASGRPGLQVGEKARGDTRTNIEPTRARLRSTTRNANGRKKKGNTGKGDHGMVFLIRRRSDKSAGRSITYVVEIFTPSSRPTYLLTQVRSRLPSVAQRHFLALSGLVS